MKRLFFIGCAVCALIFSGCASFESDEILLNVATFNMRCDLEGNKIWKGAWNLRKAMIAQMLLERDMDIVASQELYVHQMDDLKKELAGKYDYVETQSLLAFDPKLIDGRNRPAADDCEIRMHNAIWYKASRFSVLEKGSFYLSSTPEKCHLVLSQTPSAGAAYGQNLRNWLPEKSFTFLTSTRIGKTEKAVWRQTI